MHSDELEDIIYDRKSGSTHIAMKTCDFVEKVYLNIEKDKVNAMLDKILKAHRPMAILHTCIREFFEGKEPSDIRKDMKKRLELTIKRARECLQSAEIKKVMTLSSSSAVEMALSSFSGTIYVMESRPMMEGRAMAERLYQKGREVYVVSDAYGISMAARAEVDAVLVGADSIYRDSLINKVGSYGLYLAAEKSGIKFIALLTTDKIFPEDVDLSDEEIAQFHDPSEISENVGAINPYFERVPIKDHMIIITENGMDWRKVFNPL